MNPRSRNRYLQRKIEKEKADLDRKSREKIAEYDRLAEEAYNNLKISIQKKINKFDTDSKILRKALNKKHSSFVDAGIDIAQEVKIGDPLKAHLFSNDSMPETYSSDLGERCGHVEKDGNGCRKIRRPKKAKRLDDPVYCECLAKIENELRKKVKTCLNDLHKENATILFSKNQDEIKWLEETHDRISESLKQRFTSQLCYQKQNIEIKNKIDCLFSVLQNKQFLFSDAIMKQLIKITPALAPGTLECKEGREEKEHSGKSFSCIELQSQQKKILTALLKQAHRLHWDNAFLLKQGTDKAFDIIKALAFLLADMEGQTDKQITEKLKEACTQPKLQFSIEGDESLHDNPLYTALHKKRNRLGFFTPTSAIALHDLFNPPQEKTLSEKLLYRYPWGITLK